MKNIYNFSCWSEILESSRQNLDKTSTKPCVLSRIVSMTAGKRLDNCSMMARIWKYAAMLLFVFTLGVGEMRGANGDIYGCWFSYSYSGTTGNNDDYKAAGDKDKDLGTLSADLKVTSVYLKIWDDGGASSRSWTDGQLCYTTDNWVNTSYVGSGSWTLGEKDGNNYQLEKSSTNWTIASTTDASGSYTMKYYWQVWGSGDKYLNNGGSNYSFTYKVAPPAVNEGNDFTVAPSNKVSGTGTSADPFIISYGSTTAFTVTANKEHADANSKLMVSWNNGSSWSTGSLATTTSLTSGLYTPDGTKRNITIKVKFNNSTASLDGAVASRTIYYIEQTPGLTVAAGSNGKVRKSTSDSWATSALISPVEASTSYDIYAQADDHYDFKNWTSSDATHTTFGSSTSASTTATLSDGYGAVTTVTANFVEHPYTITIVGGTAASTTAKIATTGTATAKAPFGMHFTGWTVPNSNFTLVDCTTSDETITFYATATGTVTANFAQTHAYIEGRFHVTNASRDGTWTNTFSSGDWQEDSRNIEFSYDSENHYYYLHTYATPKELTTNISDLTPWFYIKSSPSTSSWTNATVNRPHASGDANQQLTTAGDANKKSADGTSGSNSFRFNSSDESGYVVIGFKKFGITYDPYIYYWLEQTLEYNGNGNTGGSAPASKTYYDKGTSVQAKSNTYTKSGYSFSGWNTKANGSGSSVAASAWYTLNANTTFYAQWSENDYTVTVNAGTGGTVGASLTTTTITGHKDSKADLPTATPDPGYYFTGWTKTSGSVTFYNQSSANTAQVNGLTAAATVQANFAPLWALAGGLEGGSNWAINDNKFTSYAENSSGHQEGTIEKTLAANSTYWIKLYKTQNDAYYGMASEASTTNVYYATSDNWWTMTNASDNQNLYVHTAAAGTYGFYWDIETSQLYVLYPTSWYITSGQKTTGQADNAGGSFTAEETTNSNADVTGCKFVANNATVRFTATPNTGYTFGGWYSESTYTTGYTAGTNVALSGEDNSVLTLSSITADKEAYAKFTPNTYTVSFDATTNGGTCGTTSKDVTYGSAYGTLPTPTPPGADSFIGWYTTASGEGALVTAETIVSITSAQTLYARYEHVYSVNVNFKCGDATVYPSTSVNASSTTLAPTITAPEIFGYTFSGWTESGSSYVTFANASSATTTITTTGAATVVANYNVVPTVYFKNNLGWDSVFVSFDITWETVGGKQVPSNKNKPYYRMTQMGTTDVYYCEIPSTYTASDYAGWAWNIAFDNTNYGSTGSTTHSGTWNEFYGGEFVGRGDFDPKTTLYIPYNGDTETRNTAKFYKTGCWMKYNSTESGYQVNMNKNVTGDSADSCTVPLTAVNAGGYEFSAKINLKRADYSYGFKLYKIYEKNTTDLWYTNTGSITAETESLPWNFWAGSSVTSTSQRCSLHTEALGDYTITVSFATGKPMVDVIYPTSVGDWRLVYNDRVAWSGDAHDASWHLYSRVIKAEANAVDTISFYVSKAEDASASIAIEKCTAINASTGAETWVKQGDNIALSSITETGIYNFKVTQNGSKVASAEYLGSYSGNFYIRTDAADGGWSNYKNSGKNLMTYSEYAEENSGFTHYFMRYVTQGTNIKFCVANDYSECLTEYCISDTYTNEYIDAYGNVRFMWNASSNAVSRAYISGSTNISDRFLVLEGDAKMFNESGTPLTTGNGRVSGLNEYEMNFRDDQNWIYEATVQAQPGARVKLTASYNNKIQYFYGDEGTTAADSVQLLGGNEESTHQYKIRVVYDFKTNRLIKAFVPDGEIDEELSIEADLMIIREHQGDAQQIQFNEEGKLTDVKSVYGAMRFNKYTVNGKSKEAGHAATGASRYERDLFYISFPFNVKLSDAFGFGTYGKHWIIEYYDGKGRAKNGFWADSDSNWKFVTPAQRSNFTMNAFEGYILALDLDEMTESSSVWNNGVEDVYVYFPSETEVENIYATEKTVTIDQTGYQCTIGSRFEGGEDRRVKDSYWHMIGAPSFANYSSAVKTSKSDGSAIDWSDSDGVIDWTSPSLPYLYVWDPEDNSLSVTRSSGNFTFKAMYSYMVQYAGTSIYWSSVNAVVPSPVAPRKADNAPTDVEFRLELLQGEEKSDQAFIKLSYDDNVTTGFDFNYDLSKEFNKNKANVYTMITSTIDNEVSVTESAGNVLPMTEQTTVVPVGVKIAANSDYTFSIPEGTEGIGVTLIDSYTGTHTNLSALDYTVSLEAGTYDDRFVLQISPIHTVPTDVETSDVGDQKSDVRKLLIDGLMYIVREGKMYDARGARVE